MSVYVRRVCEIKCAECGIIFEGHPQSKYCDDCRPIIRARQRRKSKDKRKDHERKKKASYAKMVQKSQNNIIEVAKAANAAGMSYGAFVAAGCPAPQKSIKYF